MVLDEPNSNLDSEGDQALSQALSSLKKNGATVVIVTHRPTALETADKVLILREGEMANFGEREQALRPTVSGAKFALKSRNTGKLKQTPKALDATAVKAE